MTLSQVTDKKKEWGQFAGNSQTASTWIRLEELMLDAEKAKGNIKERSLYNDIYEGKYIIAQSEIMKEKWIEYKQLYSISTEDIITKAETAGRDAKEAIRLASTLLTATGLPYTEGIDKSAQATKKMDESWAEVLQADRFAVDTITNSIDDTLKEAHERVVNASKRRRESYGKPELKQAIQDELEAMKKRREIKLVPSASIREAIEKDNAIIKIEEQNYNDAIVEYLLKEVETGKKSLNGLVDRFKSQRELAKKIIANRPRDLTKELSIYTTMNDIVQFIESQDSTFRPLEVMKEEMVEWNKIKDVVDKARNETTIGNVQVDWTDELNKLKPPTLMDTHYLETLSDIKDSIGNAISSAVAPVYQYTNDYLNELVDPRIDTNLPKDEREIILPEVRLIPESCKQKFNQLKDLRQITIDVLSEIKKVHRSDVELMQTYYNRPIPPSNMPELNTKYDYFLNLYHQSNSDLYKSAVCDNLYRIELDTTLDLFEQYLNKATALYSNTSNESYVVRFAELIKKKLEVKGIKEQLTKDINAKEEKYKQKVISAYNEWIFAKSYTNFPTLDFINTLKTYQVDEIRYNQTIQCILTHYTTLKEINQLEININSINTKLNPQVQTSGRYEMEEQLSTMEKQLDDKKRSIQCNNIEFAVVNLTSMLETKLTTARKNYFDYIMKEPSKLKVDITMNDLLGVKNLPGIEQPVTYTTILSQIQKYPLNDGTITTIVKDLIQGINYDTDVLVMSALCIQLLELNKDTYPELQKLLKDLQNILTKIEYDLNDILKLKDKMIPAIYYYHKHDDLKMNAVSKLLAIQKIPTIFAKLGLEIDLNRVDGLLTSILNGSDDSVSSVNILFTEIKKKVAVLLVPIPPSNTSSNTSSNDTGIELREVPLSINESVNDTKLLENELYELEQLDDSSVHSNASYHSAKSISSDTYPFNQSDREKWITLMENHEHNDSVYALLEAIDKKKVSKWDIVRLAIYPYNYNKKNFKEIFNIINKNNNESLLVLRLVAVRILQDIKNPSNNIYKAYMKLINEVGLNVSRGGFNGMYERKTRKRKQKHLGHGINSRFS